ncbi:MAG: uroporphyrinogen decarboxylase [Deltaproteobacteria bacterium]|nr:uroporphyrinogen decarboxylase [Deltaproteobacteria bacterium]
MTNKLRQHPFLIACHRGKTPFTPVWLMRQAGRYMKHYRDIRAKVGFLELCKTPDLVAEVTVTPVERLDVDAAIIFADILLVLEPMGVGLEYAEGGPKIQRPVRTGGDVDALRDPAPEESLSYVYDAVRVTRAALGGRVPLIGFCGAPFTLASYLIEGGASRNYIHTKRLFHTDAGAWNALMERLVTSTVSYVNAQIAAGIEALQVFDSWVGCLAPDDYRQYVLPHMRRLMAGVTPSVPVIHFGTGTSGLLELMGEAGSDVLGVDWRIDLDQAWSRVGHDVAIQGNLDPVALFAPPAEIRRRVRDILRRAEGRPGHIFNLGHGILPETPVDHVRAMVDAVHELSG